MFVLGKLALAIFAGAVPVATVVTISSLTKSASKSQLPTLKEKDKNDKYFNGACYLFENISLSEGKLLACIGLEATYYLYNESSDSNKFTKVKSLQLKNTNQLQVVLEEGKTITSTNKNWQDFPLNKEMNNNVQFPCTKGDSGWSETVTEKSSWVCTTSSPEYKQYTLDTMTLLKK